MAVTLKITLIHNDILHTVQLEWNEVISDKHGFFVNNVHARHL